VVLFTLIAINYDVCVFDKENIKNIFVCSIPPIP
jgi:hypothetical protein